MDDGLRFRELLAWIGAETDRYATWFSTREPAVWSIPVGDGKTLHDLLHHIYAVDLRLAQRLQGQPIASDAEIAVADAAGLFALAGRGQALLAAADATGDYDAILTWTTLLGFGICATRRKILGQALTHHLRHLAQVAMLLRLHGHPTDWNHDLLVSEAMG